MKSAKKVSMAGESASEVFGEQGEQLQRSFELMTEIADEINGLRIKELPTCRRLQLAAACWHIGIEHGQAILILLDQERIGSALALQRPAIDSFLRGVWLRFLADRCEIERATQDIFPSLKFVDKQIKKRLLEGKNTVMNEMFGPWWGQLCSYTHTGKAQILSRLTERGLEPQYDADEIRQAVRLANLVQLVSAAQLAAESEDPGSAERLLKQLGQVGDF